jgi:hypothetical protein
MYKQIIAALIASGVAFATIAGSASAQATGTPGEPQCHGERVSYGSSVFDITPKDRAGFLGISVKEFQERVRASCEAQDLDQALDEGQGKGKGKGQGKK